MEKKEGFGRGFGLWVLAAVVAMVVGALMHRRAIMACAPIILVLYFIYLLYGMFVKTDTPKGKRGREDSFNDDA